MEQSRTKSALKNSAYTVFNKIFQIVMAFVFRTLMIRFLGMEILGLDGLFSSILTILNMADLGISSAIMFSLYKPLAENNERKVYAIMQFFQTFYLFVAGFVFFGGACLIPTLPYIVNLPADVNNINLIYILTVSNTAMSYVFSSRNIIFEASQKGYKLSVINTANLLIMQTMQIACVLIFKNYIAVLIGRLLLQVAFNMFIYFYAKSQYSLFSKFKHIKLTRLEKKEMFGNVGAVFCHKIGGVMVTGTDNLIISIFVGTIVVGMYSNYLLIMGSLTALIVMGCTAVTASVGNLRESNKNIEDHYKVYKMINITLFLVNSFVNVCLFCLLNVFIKAWAGNNYLFSMSAVLVLCLNNYISTMRQSISNFAAAAGLFKKTILKPILEGIINLIVSLSTVKYIGILGVFLGTTASLVLGSLWVDPYVTYKHWFKKPLHLYFLEYSWMLVVTVLLAVINYYVISTFALTNLWADFVVKAIIVSVITGCLLLLVVWKTQGFKMLLQRIIGISKRKKKAPILDGTQNSSVNIIEEDANATLSAVSKNEDLLSVDNLAQQDNDNEYENK